MNLGEFVKDIERMIKLKNEYNYCDDYFYEKISNILKEHDAPKEHGMIITVTFKGKRDDIDHYQVNTHKTEEDAKVYCDENNDEYRNKYWTITKIVTLGEKYDLDDIVDEWERKE